MTLDEAREATRAGLERGVQAFEAGAPAQGFTAAQIAATAAAMRLDNIAGLDRAARAWLIMGAAR